MSYITNKAYDHFGNHAISRYSWEDLVEARRHAETLWAASGHSEAHCNMWRGIFEDYDAEIARRRKTKKFLRAADAA